MFKFLMKNDPVLGINTFGQMARFGPERCYVMHQKLSELENGGWEEKKEFDRFKHAMSGIGEGVNGKQFFNKMTKIFFERYRFVFDKHMGSKWCSNVTLHYILGGDPEHAQQFALWLVDYKGRIFDEAEGTSESPPFAFPNEEVTLGKHHTMMHGDIKVNLQASMEYITSEAERDVILEDPFVVEHWVLIGELAESFMTVRLFDKFENGKIDKSTWGEVDYEPLLVGIVSAICPHSSHQQRCENYVQLTGLLSKTGVGEVRRSNRAIMISDFLRPFNSWGLEEKNKMQKENNKPTVARLQGSDKTYLYLKFITTYFKKADKAKLIVSKERLNGLKERMGSSTNKASAAEIEKKLDKFRKSLNKKQKQVTSELAAGIEKTAHMAGAVFLKLLTGTNNMADSVEAEIKARKIKVSATKLKTLSLAEKRKLLKIDELKNRIGEDLKEADIKYIVPVSEVLKMFLQSNKQQDILNKEAGIVTME